jgi:hypothetical protein
MEFRGGFEPWQDGVKEKKSFCYEDMLQKMLIKTKKTIKKKVCSLAITTAS